MQQQPVFSLAEIEGAVRPQFTWDREYARSRWRNSHQELTNFNEWMGAAVFVGVAALMGHSLPEIKTYMDLEPYEVDDRLKFFKKNSQAFTARLVKGKEEVLRKRPDTQSILYRKVSLTINALRMLEQYKRRRR